MTTADQLGFKERPLALSMTLVGSTSPGELIDRPGINDGDLVSLQYDGVRVEIRNTVKKDDDTYSGTIYGFEQPTGGVQYKELKIDSDITFREIHALSCTRQE